MPTRSRGSTRLMTEPRVSSRPARLPARAEHELRGVLGPGEVARARRPTSAPATSWYVAAELLDERALLLERLAGRPGEAVLAERTCTPSSSPCVRAAMRAARRISRSPPGAPVSATTTRSRVSHGPVDAVALAVVLRAPRRRGRRPRAARARAARRGCRGGSSCASAASICSGRVDVAVRHAPAQRLGRHVDELDLVGAAHDVVGDRLALLDAGDLLDDVVQRLEVLDVDASR